MLKAFMYGTLTLIVNSEMFSCFFQHTNYNNTAQRVYLWECKVSWQIRTILSPLRWDKSYPVTPRTACAKFLVFHKIQQHQTTRKVPEKTIIYCLLCLSMEELCSIYSIVLPVKVSAFSRTISVLQLLPESCFQRTLLQIKHLFTKTLFDIFLLR